MFYQQNKYKNKNKTCKNKNSLLVGFQVCLEVTSLNKRKQEKFQQYPNKMRTKIKRSK